MDVPDTCHCPSQVPHPLTTSRSNIRVMDRTNIAAHAMSEDGYVIYVVTSDQEKAIRKGLGKSQMQGTHLHCICSLHQMGRGFIHLANLIYICFS